MTRFFAKMLCLALATQFGCGDAEPSKQSGDDFPTGDSSAGMPEKSAAQTASDQAAEKSSSKDEDSSAPTGGPENPAATPKTRTACTTTWKRPVQNLKMEDIVGLINTLPKPVTIPCVLDTLPRPFALNATDSDLSVQPGKGMESPRIFIVIDFLIITFTLSEDVEPALEFSQLLSDDRSVKGEIAFPVSQDLLPEAPYLQVVRAGNVGTRCAGCHFGEQPAGSAFPENVFSSRALRPFDRQNVSLEILKALKNNCAGSHSERCDMLNAIYNGDPPTEYKFPAAMPTLF